MKKFFDTLRRAGLCVLVPAACFLAGGCTTPVDTAPAGFGEGEPIAIAQGTVADFGELRIGLASIRKIDGGENKQLMAVLKLFFDTKPPQQQRFDVFAGQAVTWDKYTLYIQEIRGVGKGTVKLLAKAADQPPASREQDTGR